MKYPRGCPVFKCSCCGWMFQVTGREYDGSWPAFDVANGCPAAIVSGELVPLNVAAREVMNVLSAE